MRAVGLVADFSRLRWFQSALIMGLSACRSGNLAGHHWTHLTLDALSTTTQETSIAEESG